jgi:hypothetical protein
MKRQSMCRFREINSKEPRELSRYSDRLRAGQPGFNSLQEQETSFFSIVSIQGLWPS